MKGSKQPVKEGTGLEAAGFWGYGKQSVVQCTTYKITIHFVQERLNSMDATCHYMAMHGTLHCHIAIGTITMYMKQVIC